MSAHNSKNNVNSWGNCPDCNSDNIEKINVNIIIIVMWVIGFIITYFYLTFGIIGLILSLIITIKIKTVAKTPVKCNECNKTWLYPPQEDKKTN